MGGAVGVNLEDTYHETLTMMPEEEAVERIRRALAVARELGVDDFALNARSDALYSGEGDIDESIRRGRLYLEAGATTVYVFWPRTTEMLEEDVKKVIDGLDGRVNIQPRKASAVQRKELTSGDVARLAAARVSIGPQLLWGAAEAIKKRANEIFGH
ncbi:hypothetical protein VTK26DRAFT_4061 [Humicola hyalothermophila]